MNKPQLIVITALAIILMALPGIAADKVAKGKSQVDGEQMVVFYQDNNGFKAYPPSQVKRIGDKVEAVVVERNRIVGADTAIITTIVFDCKRATYKETMKCFLKDGGGKPIIIAPENIERGVLGSLYDEMAYRICNKK